MSEKTSNVYSFHNNGEVVVRPPACLPWGRSTMGARAAVGLKEQVDCSHMPMTQAPPTVQPEKLLGASTLEL